MDAQNPYAAPRADLGQSFDADGLDGAIAEFRAARGSMLGVAVMLIVMAVAASVSMLTTLASLVSEVGGELIFPYLTMLLSWLTEIAGALAVLWWRASFAKLASDPTPRRLTELMANGARFWLFATVLWCVPAISGLGVSLVTLILPALGMTLAAASDDPIRAASRMRNAIRAFLVAGGVLLLGRAAVQLLGPMSHHFMQLKLWLFGGILTQLALGAAIWLQVPPLETFIATPTSANLAAVAAAQRRSWRYLFMLAAAAFVLSLLGNVAIRFFG